MEESAQPPSPRSPATADRNGAALATARTTAADDEPAPQMKPGARDGPGPKQLKTRNLDYILRSGVAGGLAGCAVSIQ